MIGSGGKSVRQGIYSEGLTATAPSVIFLDLEVAEGRKKVHLWDDSQIQNPIERLPVKRPFIVVHLCARQKVRLDVLDSGDEDCWRCWKHFFGPRT